MNTPLIILASLIWLSIGYIATITIFKGNKVPVGIFILFILLGVVTVIVGIETLLPKFINFLRKKIQL